MSSRPEIIRRAALDPIALGTLGVASIAGLTLALWLLPLGLLAYAAQVLLLLRAPAPVAPPRPTPRPVLSSAPLNARLAAISLSRDAIAESAAGSAAPLARLLDTISSQAGALVDDAWLLAERGEIIERYLTVIDTQTIGSDIARLEAQLAATSDDYTVEQLRQALAARREKRDNAAALQTFRARIDAQLLNIAATLENTLAETIRLRTADAVGAGDSAGEVTRRLSDLRADMDAFRQVLDTAVSRGAP